MNKHILLPAAVISLPHFVFLKVDFLIFKE